MCSLFLRPRLLLGQEHNQQKATEWKAKTDGLSKEEMRDLHEALCDALVSPIKDGDHVESLDDADAVDDHLMKKAFKMAETNVRHSLRLW